MSLKKTVYRSYTLHQRTKTVDVMTNTVVTEDGVVIAEHGSAAAYALSDRTKFLLDTADDPKAAQMAAVFDMTDAV